MEGVLFDSDELESEFVGQSVVGSEEELPVGAGREMVGEEWEQSYFFVIGYWSSVGCIADYDVVVPWLAGQKYESVRLSNGDTLKELLARGRYALFKSPEKWTDSQRQRIDLMFSLYPDLKEAYWLSQNLRTIFSNKKSTADTARLNLAHWYNRVAESGFRSFNTIAATFYEHSDEIINYFDNRSTNASAESINSKIKAFRAKFHGINDTKFFIFRLCNLYA